MVSYYMLEQARIRKFNQAIDDLYKWITEDITLGQIKIMRENPNCQAVKNLKEISKMLGDIIKLSKKNRKS